MATDPPSNGHPELNNLLKQNMTLDNPRVPVHTFDSAASPAEKGAAAKAQADDSLQSVVPQQNSSGRGEPLHSSLH